MARPKKSEENIHSAARREDCVKMGKKYGWELKRVKDNGSDILPKDCIFEGEQVSFTDMWNDNQE